MKKLALDVDTLSVESFDTGEVDAVRGTVEAQSHTPLFPLAFYLLTRLLD